MTLFGTECHDLLRKPQPKKKRSVATLQNEKMKNLFRKKSLDALVSDTQRPNQQLKRSLGWVQLTSLGIGAIIGAGIFSTVGSAAAGGSSHDGAGPALVLSFVLVAIACGFAAFCYAEFAAMVPVSGSAFCCSGAFSEKP